MASREKVEELLRVMRSEQGIRQMYEGFSSTSEQHFSKKEKEENALVLAAYGQVFCDQFTDAEVDKLIAHYMSPEMQKMNSPEFSRAFGELMYLGKKDDAPLFSKPS